MLTVLLRFRGCLNCLACPDSAKFRVRRACVPLLEASCWKTGDGRTSGTLRMGETMDCMESFRQLQFAAGESFVYNPTVNSSRVSIHGKEIEEIPGGHDVPPFRSGAGPARNGAGMHCFFPFAPGRRLLSPTETRPGRTLRNADTAVFPPSAGNSDPARDLRPGSPPVGRGKVKEKRYALFYAFTVHPH